MDDRLEIARLLARYKLAVRRSLQQSVDLQLMVQDRNYADFKLRETEDAAGNEELLILIVQLREALFPAAPVQAVIAAPINSALIQSDSGQTRTYVGGARSW